MNAFQILGFFDFTDTGINLLKSLYGTLARVYDFLLQLASGTSANNFSSVIEGVTSTFYAIAGVFMLFRITISAVNMLINPDEISDKNAGGSKLITNIIVTIMLLFLLQPGGFIYTQLGRLETAILGDSKTNDPGFISELIKPVQSTAGVDNSNKVNKDKNDIASSLPFIENVYAAGPLTCYFVQPVGRLADSGEHGIIKLTFYDSKVAGSVSISNADESYPGYVVSGAGTSESFQYNNESRSIRFINYFGNNSYAVPKVGSPGIADVFIDEFPTSCSSITLRAESGADLLNFDGPVYLVNDNWFQNSKSWNTTSIGTGYSDLSSAYTRYIKYLSNSSENNDATITNDNPNHDQLTDDAENYNDYIASLNVNQSAVDFSNAVISSFYNCNNVSDKVSEEDHETCEKMVTQILNEDTDDIQDFINDDIIDWDFLIGLLLGFAFIIYIVFLCIDVIVRNFKIILLQMIAPIPIINGIDPKDKMRSQWVKMYAGTYLSLFIKLFAIKLVSALLTIDVISEISTNSAFGGTMVKLFYIVALLVFAKLVPDILSKIFGLNDMAGSFKDIANMAKTTLGVGAGAALAAGAGVLATGAGIASGKGWKQKVGAGLTGLGGIAAGTIRGAGAGSRGNITKGASNVLSAAKLQRDARASGATYAATKKASLLNKLGFADDYEKAVALRDVNQEYASTAKAYEDESLNKVNKSIGKGHGSKFTNLLEARNDAAAITRGEKISRYKADEHGHIVNKLTGETVKNANGSVISVNSLTGQNMLNVTEESYALTAAEANARINGEEKAASQQIRDVFVRGDSNELRSYGFERNDDDFLEMASLRSDADEAARNAGYAEGYSKQTKNEAKQKAKQYSAEARAHKADHDAAQRNNNK